MQKSIFLDGYTSKIREERMGIAVVGNGNDEDVQIMAGGCQVES